jgi:hypothetical protein
MSAPIPLRAYVVGGLVTVEVVNALLRFGEPMITDTREFEDTLPFRAWLRSKAGGRTFGRNEPTVQLAAEDLLGKLRGMK